MRIVTEVEIIKYLTILELPTNQLIDIEILKKQYRKLSKIYHPDVSKEDSYKNGDKFKNLNSAYEYILHNIDRCNMVIQYISNGYLFNSDYKHAEMRKHESKERERQEHERQEREKQEEESRARERQEHERHARNEELLRKFREFITNNFKFIVSGIVSIIFIVLIFFITYRKVEILNGSGNQVANIHAFLGKPIINLSEPEREGYNFLGYYIDQDCTISPSDETVTFQTKFLYSKWELKKYKVSFYDNDNSLITQIEVEHGMRAVSPIIPTKRDYEFERWDGDISNVTKDIAVSAIYKYSPYYSKGLSFEIKKYELYNGYYEVIGYFGDEIDVIVPKTYKGIPVVSIGKGAFKNKSKIKSISLPEGLKIIENDAFSSCSILEKVIIPSTVIEIKSYAFYESRKLIIYCRGSYHENWGETWSYNYSFYDDAVYNGRMRLSRFCEVKWNYSGT